MVECLESRTLLSTSNNIVENPNIVLTSSASAGTTIRGYSPSQISAAYGFSQVKLAGGNGAGQTIAIVDAYNDPNIARDLSFFDSTFGVGAASLTVVSQTGSTTVLPKSDGGWAQEISLDVEWAHAMAPSANILLVEANSSSLSDLLSAVDYARHALGVTTVSMSWGGSEFYGQTSYDSYFTTPPGHKGVTFVASTGDNGAYWGPQWPSSSPNVLAVGGSSLNIVNGSYSSESAWSGSTGGYSNYEYEPGYQASAQNTGLRTVPDVSYNANPNTGFAVYDSLAYNGQSGWAEVGGTSAGAPQWAAIIAIANQSRKIAGEATLSGATGTLPILYSVYSSTTGYSAAFHDVTSGNYSSTYPAQAGYDLVTGIGTPRVSVIVRDLTQGGAGAAAKAAAVANATSAAMAHAAAMQAQALAAAVRPVEVSSSVRSKLRAADPATDVLSDPSSPTINQAGGLPGDTGGGASSTGAGRAAQTSLGHFSQTPATSSLGSDNPTQSASDRQKAIANAKPVRRSGAFAHGSTGLIDAGVKELLATPMDDLDLATTQPTGFWDGLAALVGLGFIIRAFNTRRKQDRAKSGLESLR